MRARLDRLRDLSRTQIALVLLEEHQVMHRRKIVLERTWFICFAAFAALNSATSRAWLLLIVEFVMMSLCALYWHKNQQDAEKCLHHMQDQINEIVFDDYSGQLGVDWGTREVVSTNSAQNGS